MPEECDIDIVGFTGNWGAEIGVNGISIDSVTAGTERETSVNNSSFTALYSLSAFWSSADFQPSISYLNFSIFPNIFNTHK